MLETKTKPTPSKPLSNLNSQLISTEQNRDQPYIQGLGESCTLSLVSALVARSVSVFQFAIL